MNKTNKSQEEKRAAWKRYSKMGAASLAVFSLSAFTNLSAQQLPDSVKPKPVITDTLTYSEPDTIPQGDRYGDSSGYNNYGNNYTNAYGDAGYSNHYSNYCDAQ